MFKELISTYKNSLKENDITWNIYVARPVAAVFVFFLKRTPLTPNQVTFLGLLVFILSLVPMLAKPDAMGFLFTVLLIQLAYVLDCVDGQLARIKHMTSEAGAYLDFLIDEIKAVLMMGGIGAHLWLRYDEPLYLIVGILGGALVSIATSLTTFVRRPEYTGVDIKPGESARRAAEKPPGGLGTLIWLVKRVMSYFVHYPSWILYAALFGVFAPQVTFKGVTLDGANLFTLLFLGVYAIYVAKTSLGVFLKLASPGYYKK